MAMMKSVFRSFQKPVAHFRLHGSVRRLNQSRIVLCSPDAVNGTSSASSSIFLQRTSWLKSQMCLNHPFKLIHTTPYNLEYKERDTSAENCMYFDEFKSCVENDSIHVIDVRTQEEVDNGRVPAKRYLHVHVSELEHALTKLSDEEFESTYGQKKPDKGASDIIFFCRKGLRSTAAMNIAKNAGFTKSRHYPGGWNEWSEKVGI